MMNFDNTQRHFNNRRGFNLIELAIVIAVVGLVIGGIWLAVSSVYENLRVSNAQKQSLQVVQNIRNLYAGAPNFAGSTMRSLVDANVFPAEMVIDSATPVVNHPWNSTASVAAAGGANELIALTFDNIPQAACIELVVANAASAQQAQQLGLTLVDVNGASLSPPILPTGTSCAAGSANTITWYYTMRG